ncbi:DUF572-domain-containing protein, partial [Violaceomyces palustris]
PPDFDPSKVPRRKIAKDAQQTVRLMAPFTMRCKSCGEFIYKGKKFNARKETVLGEDYYGIKIFRFYIKCTQCSSEITFKTDPKNTDYVAEHGATRNAEPWREEGDGEEEEEDDDDRLVRLEREREEQDPMKKLEERTIDSRREMEILDKLQDIRTRNARMERIDSDLVLEAIEEREKGKRAMNPEELERLRAEEEDERMVKRYFGRAMDVQIPLEVEGGETSVVDPGSRDGGGGSEGKDPKRSTIVKRRSEQGEEEKEPDVKSLLSERARNQLETVASGSGSGTKKKRKPNNAFGIVQKKKSGVA